MDDATTPHECRTCPCGDRICLKILDDGSRWWMNLFCTPEAGCMHSDEDLAARAAIDAPEDA